MLIVLRHMLPALCVAFLAACAPSRDAHVPDFARKSFEPFSREAAIAVALREWRMFGEIVVDEGAPAADAPDPAASAERRQGLWQRVGEYWWLGLNAGDGGQGYTGLHDEEGRRFAPERDGAYAWSAAFVSYVMRIAGAGRRFPYAASHFVYINEAVRASRGLAEGSLLRAEDPARYAPQPGDLVCVGRGPNQALRYADLPRARFWGHCDIAVRSDGVRLAVIGGNVRNAVALKYLPLLADGRLAVASASVAPDRPWLVVLRVLYDAPSGAS